MSTNAIFAQAQQLQRTYWTYHAREHFAIKQLFEQPNHGGLTYVDLLRLHHLNCLELVQEELGHGLPQKKTPPTPERLPPFAHRVLEVLLGANSPYAAGIGALWLAQSEEEQPDFKGGLFNSALTHLNSLECFQVDDQGQPTKLEFVPFRQVQSIAWADNAPYRPAMLTTPTGQRSVLFSGVYGLSAHSTLPIDLDGSNARTLRTYSIPSLGTNLSIALGQQQFLANDGRTMRLVPSLALRRLGTAT